MYETRFIGVIAAVLIVLAAIREISKFIFAISVNETIDLSAIRHDLYVTGLAILIGIIALSRVAILARFSSASYSWKAWSWLVLAVFLCYFVWLTYPIDNSHHHCAEDGNCFSIYDMRDYTNFLSIAAIFFIVLSVPRSLITIGYVLTRPRLR